MKLDLAPGAQLDLFEAPANASGDAVQERGTPEILTAESQGALAAAILEELFAAHPIGKKPTLEWRRYRTTAGTASFQRHAIGLNARLLTTEERLRSTLIHEYAHLLAYHRAGRSGRDHGHPWRQAMIDLDGKPEVKHRYECERNGRRQRVVYRCKRCGVVIHRHRRYPQGRRYVHIDCGGAIVLQRIEALHVDR